jgi:hypothetical protein
MILIPRKRFSIETMLTVDEAVQVLSRVVQPRKFWPNPFSDDRKEFEGGVSKEGFKFIRNIYYMNSFLPTIKGTFDWSDGVTKIRIILAGNPCVLIAMIAAFAFFGYFLLSALIGIVSGLFLVSGALILGALGYLFYTFAFNVVSNSDREFLIKLFSQLQKK